MSLTEKFEKRAYPAALAGLVLMAASIQIKIQFGGEVDTLILLLTTIAIMATLFFVDYLSKSMEFRVLLGVIIAFVAFFVWCEREEVLELVETEKNVLIFGIIVIAGVALYISQQFFALRIIVCVGYWGAMLCLIFVDLFPVRQVMYYLAGELILVLAEIVNRSVRDKKEVSNKKMLFLTPIILIVILVLSALPYSAKPIDWKAMYEWVVVRLKGEDASEKIPYSGIGFTGYSEATNLRGNRFEIDRETLKLTMVGNKEHVYLIGNIKSDYVGDGWSGSPVNSEYEGNYKEYEFDAAEFLYAMYRGNVIDGNKAESGNGDSVWYLRLRDITVEYDGMRTASLFRPAKTIRISPEKYQGEILDNKDDISFSGRQDIDTSYTLKYYSVNRGWKAAIDLIKEQSMYTYDTMSEEDYKEFRKVVNLEYHTIGLPDTEDFEEELAKRADYIRETYLKVPNTITEKTYWLAEEIIEGCETDYDKMERIVQYLSYYTYTTTLGDIPLDKDVVEYFLFEIGKGYCTHFASAAAILGRCVGIPTRFVQGYLLDAELVGQYGRYNVNEKQAHAWIECYFEGVGWLTFDPTPGSSDFLYQEWEIPENVIDKVASGNTSEEETTTELPKESATEDIFEDSEGYIEKSTESYFQVVPGDESDEDVKKDDKAAKMRGLIIVGVVLLLIMIILYTKVRENSFWEKYEAAPYGERLRIDMLLTLWIIKREGYPIRSDETLREYVKRISGFFPEKAKLLLTVSELYQQIRYSKSYEATAADQRTSQRLRLSFMSDKVSVGAMVRYGNKIL